MNAKEEKVERKSLEIACSPQRVLIVKATIQSADVEKSSQKV